MLGMQSDEGEHGRALRVLSLAAAVVFLAAGCATYTTPQRYDRGLVLVLPGVEGRSVFNQQIVEGLDRGGVPYALEIHDWTSGLAPLFLWHLMDHRRNCLQAQRIADRLTEYADQYPNRPIWLVGQSGGGGMAVLALDLLPPGLCVDGAVLISPAIGRDYGLARALGRLRGKMIHYYSSKDLFFLGMGTGVFGNIDRSYGESAGRCGFRLPEDLTAEEAQRYETRLEQVDCSEGVPETGHLGLHLTSSSPDFVEKVIAPLLLGTAPSSK